MQNWVKGGAEGVVTPFLPIKQQRSFWYITSYCAFSATNNGYVVYLKIKH